MNDKRISTQGAIGLLLAIAVAEAVPVSAEMRDQPAAQEQRGSATSGTPEFHVGEREIVATKAQRDDLGLKWFPDGNLGMVQAGAEVRLYGANGQSPVCVTGTREQPL